MTAPQPDTRLIDAFNIPITVGCTLRDSRDGSTRVVAGILDELVSMDNGKFCMCWDAATREYFTVQQSQYRPGAVWVRNEDISPCRYCVAIVDECVANPGLVLRLEPAGELIEWSMPEECTIQGYLENRVYVGNVDDLVAGLVALCGSPSRPATQPLREEDVPKTFPVCPDCGERLPESGCRTPACFQAAKLALARQREAKLHSDFAAFEEAVRWVAAEEAPLAIVTTDIGMNDLRCNGKEQVFIAWLDFKDGRDPGRWVMAVTEPRLNSDYLRREIRHRLGRIGAALLGKKSPS